MPEVTTTHAHVPFVASADPHDRVAFLSPGVLAVLRAAKPEVLRYSGDSLGAQLRRRRRELGIRQCDAARTMGADPKSVWWWERDGRPPLVHMYPALIAFLGCEPWPEPETLGEALRAERRRRGLAVKQAAPLVGVDEGTWLRWELGERRPGARSRKLIGEFLGGGHRYEMGRA